MEFLRGGSEDKGGDKSYEGKGTDKDGRGDR